LEWILTTEAGQARELLAQAVEADKDLLWARLELAGWYGERGLYEEASELLAVGDQSEPALLSARLDLDSDLWGQVVLAQLAQLGRSWPKSVRVNTTVAERAADAQRWDLAEEAMVRLEELIPGVIEVLDLREYLAESCGDGQALRGVFADLLEFDPNQPVVRVRLARLLRAEQDLADARNVLGKGLDRSPSNVDLMMELATIEHLGGNESDAVALASEVLVIRPQDRRAQRLLELLGESSEDLGWLRTPEELRVLADETAPSDPAVVVLDHRELRFLPSNLTEERVQKAILITAADRADDLLTFTVPFVAEKERLRMLAARIHRRDGAEISASQGDTPRLSEPEFNLYYDTVDSSGSADTDRLGRDRANRSGGAFACLGARPSRRRTGTGGRRRGRDSPAVAMAEPPGDCARRSISANVAGDALSGVLQSPGVGKPCGLVSAPRGSADSHFRAGQRNSTAVDRWT
jgi:Tfp pilus assembly protein PilF